VLPVSVYNTPMVYPTPEVARAFRQQMLREMQAKRPRRWDSGEPGGEPMVLHNHDNPASLHERFVRYLDVQLELHTWQQQWQTAIHQRLEWWADTLEELDDR